MIPLDLTLKAGKSVKNFKSALSQMINQSGGLPLDEELLEDDIEIPKSEFIDEDEDIKDAVMEDTNSNTQTVDPENLTFATPRDKSDPYSNQWITIDEDVLGNLEFNDYDIIAFALNEEDFNIVEAAYEE